MRARAVVLWTELGALQAALPTWTRHGADLPGSFRVGLDEPLRESDRHLRLLGRLLLARALARLGSDPLTALAFDATGRPRLPGDLDPSISHTAGLACAAVAIGCRIGVDVERRQPIEPAVRDRILAPAERRRMARSRDPVGDLLGFWTMKEAAAKADGRGLQLDPRALACRPGSVLSAPAVRIGPATYRLERLHLPAGWIGHLAHDAARPIELVAEAYSFS